MTTLTLQSISAAGGSQQPQTVNQGSTSRIAEASAVAGVRQAENERRAQAASTQFQKDYEKRSIQIRPRAEGNSEGREAEDQETKEQENQPIANPKGSFHRTA